MQNEFQPVDELVKQIKGNASFLKKLIFNRINVVALTALSALFLIAALTNK